MYRILTCLLAILLGFVGTTSRVFGQAHGHAAALQQPTASAYWGMTPTGGSVYYATGHDQHGLTWSILSIVGGTMTVQPAVYPAYFYYFPFNPTPTTQPNTSFRYSRPAWLEPEERLPARPPRTIARHANKTDRARAEKSLAQGDASFTREKYRAAFESYRGAAKLSPDWAEPHFRQGFTLAASGNYPQAVAAFRAGMKLRIDWTDSPFRLDTIYAEGALDKTNQKIAQRLEQDPVDRDALFTKGMQLYFAGQQQQATVYLSQAASLAAAEPELLEAFLECLAANPKPE